MGLGYGSNNGTSSGSASYGNSKLDMRYRGVGQQTSIQTGDGGFNITTQGNTNLRGSVIKSTEQAIQDNKNQLTTATLTTSDMRNSSRADAQSMGLSLSTDMFEQGKYGTAKAVAGALLNNGEGKRQTIGKTVTAMSTARVNITDDQAQQALTGQTVQQAIDAINVDTIYTHLQADQANAEAAQQMAQTKQALKMAVYRETVKFADEAYRTAYVAKAEMYKLQRDESGKVELDEKTGKPLSIKLSSEEKLNLKPGKDGKIHIFNNGIFNGKLDDPAAAAKYANQLANAGDGEIYIIHFPQAENALSELMVAGFQHFLEGGIADASNATAKNVELMRRYGRDGLDITAHSRGSDTTGNAMQILAKDNANNGVLSNTSIHYFGPADHAQDAANQLNQLSNSRSNYVELQNHNVDVVGGGFLFGNNPVTYGEIPDSSNTFNETLNMLNIGSGDHDHTVHNCYGANSDPQCKPYGVPKTLRIYSNGSNP